MNKVNVPKLRFPGFDGEWEEKSIEELCSMQAGKFISASEIKEYFAENLFPCYGGNGLRGYTNSFNYDGNYSLIGRQGALCGNITFVKAKFHATEHAIVVKVSHNIDNKLMYYILNILNLNQYATGQAQPGLSVQNIKKVDVSITESLPEQQKIASFLSAVDEKIQQLSRKKELVEQYKKGIMQQLFSGKVRFKPDQSEAEGDGNGKDFPDWEEKRLGEIGNIITGKTPNTSDSSLWNGTIQFITPTDIKDGVKFQETTERHVVNNDKIKILPINSIIYTCIASIGKMCISKFPCITNQQINSLVVDEKYNFEYVYYWLFYVTPYIKSTQANTTLPIINKTDFSKFSIKIPLIEEQEKIANFLSNIDVKIENTNQEINQMQDFKKGLLQQMFV